MDCEHGPQRGGKKKNYEFLKMTSQWFHFWIRATSLSKFTSLDAQNEILFSYVRHTCCQKKKVQNYLY